jgi:hypothetical protein
VSVTVPLTCGECGVEFCMPEVLLRARKRDGETFYCPNGHPRVFRPTADQERIAELEKQLARRRRIHDDLAARYGEALAQREELIGSLRECPGRCGWRSRKQVPRDPVGMGRGLERVRLDVAEHLVRVHGAQPVISEPRQLEAG